MARTLPAALLLCLLFLASAQRAHAGINAWTSHGPGTGLINVLVVDPTAPSTLYAGTAGGVFKSTDGGGTWNATGVGPPARVHALAIDPVTPDTLYAATYAGLFTSTNGGATWSTANTGLHGSADTLAVDPMTPTTLYAVMRAGVFKSADSGNTWNAASTGLPGGDSYVSALAIDPNTPGTLYAGLFRDNCDGFLCGLGGIELVAAVRHALRGCPGN